MITQNFISYILILYLGYFNPKSDVYACFFRYPNLVNNETLWVLKDWVSGDKSHQSRSFSFKISFFILLYVLCMGM